jgi:hypothetical protein
MHVDAGAVVLNMPLERYLEAACAPMGELAATDMSECCDAHGHGSPLVGCRAEPSESAPPEWES